MIEAGAESTFAIDSVRRLKPTAQADLIQEGTDGWTMRTTDRGVIAPDRIEVLSGKGVISLTHDVDWMAEDIDVLSFELTNLGRRGRAFRVYWARPGEVFSQTRSVRPVKRSQTTAVAQMAGHQDWNGRIARIRIGVPSPARGKTILSSVAPMVFEYDPGLVAAAAEALWKVDLVDDLRKAGMATGMHDLVWELPEPRCGLLTFSWGLLGAGRDELPVAVAVRTASGDWTEVYASREGASTASDEDDESIEGWRDIQIDLESSAPAHAIRFSVERRRSDGRSAGIAAIANPVITQKRPESDTVNIVLISLDTLRADRLAPYGHHEVTSPNLDSRAAGSGIFFESAVAASPWTLPSHTSMLTGLDCVSHGVNHPMPAPGGLETLAEILRRQGYSTIAVVGGGLLNPEFGLDQGFDEYYHYSGGMGGFNELDIEMPQMLDKLSRSSDRPFFGFFHTYEIHDPFHERSPFTDQCYEQFGDESDVDFVYGAIARPRSKDDGFLLFNDLVKWKRTQSISSAVPAEPFELDLVRCLYDASITYTDRVVEGLFVELERRGLSDNTMVVITSDHGESLGEKGLYKHAYLYENNLMVPLVVFLPGGRHGGEVIEHQVATADIVPTILDVLGFEPPSGLDGESLLPLIEDPDEAGHRSEAWSYAAFENRGVSMRIDGHTKYIFNNTATSTAFGDEELYKLVEDPEELRNLAADDSDLLDRLQHRVESYFESHTVGIPLTIENLGCDRVDGLLIGERLSSRLKTFDLEEDNFRMQSNRQVVMKIGRGRRAKVFVEATDSIEIELRAEGCGAGAQPQTTRRELRFQCADMPVVIGLSGSGWLDLDLGEAEGADDLSVVLRAGFQCGDTDATPDSVDDVKVLEQLRELGYVE